MSRARRARLSITVLCGTFVASMALSGFGTLAAAPPHSTPQPNSSLSPAQTALPMPNGPPATLAPAGPAPVLAPAASPTPSGVLVRYAGQILDVRGGFIFFTSGDGFRLDPNVKRFDYFTGKPTNIPAALRIYARASFDPLTRQVVQLDLSRNPVPPEASYQAAHEYAVTASPYKPNPELDTPKSGLTGKIVPVTFTALVPATTNLTDSVYIETDQSGWDPQAIKLDRIDALHYRVTLRLPSGTDFLYRYTRGSAQYVERARNGIEQPARSLLVPEVDVKNQDDVVYNWADTNPSAGGNSAPNPNSIPTPFNPDPFPFPVPVPRKTLKP